jgi:hypothetical protein
MSNPKQAGLSWRGVAAAAGRTREREDLVGAGKEQEAAAPPPVSCHSQGVAELGPPRV